MQSVLWRTNLGKKTILVLEATLGGFGQGILGFLEPRDSIEEGRCGFWMGMSFWPYRFLTPRKGVWLEKDSGWSAEPGTQGRPLSWGLSGSPMVFGREGQPASGKWELQFVTCFFFHCLF